MAPQQNYQQTEEKKNDSALLKHFFLRFKYLMDKHDLHSPSCFDPCLSLSLSPTAFSSVCLINLSNKGSAE